MKEKNFEKCLKDFIYMDKDRLYSLYSQIFEGVIESLVTSRFVDEENQKTDKKLEQRLIEASFKSQNIVLFDHMYNMLEEKMQPYIFNIDSKTAIDDIPIDGIVKVSGEAVIDDYEHLGYFFENYNSIGESLAAITLISNNNSSISNNGIERYAKDNNLHFDKKFISSMVNLIRFFHDNAIDLSIRSSANDNLICCAVLNPKGLRINANELRTLYGSHPIMNWSVVGQVTNISSRYYNQREKFEANTTSFRAMFDRLEDVDKSLDKILEQGSNIVKIAPIAVYVEHKKFNANSF